MRNWNRNREVFDVVAFRMLQYEYWHDNNGQFDFQSLFLKYPDIDHKHQAKTMVRMNRFRQMDDPKNRELGVNTDEMLREYL